MAFHSVAHEVRAIIKLALKTLIPIFLHLLALTVDVCSSNSKRPELVLLHYLVLQDRHVIIFKQISPMETEIHMV